MDCKMIDIYAAGDLRALQESCSYSHYGGKLLQPSQAQTHTHTQARRQAIPQNSSLAQLLYSTAAGNSHDSNQ